MTQGGVTVYELNFDKKKKILVILHVQLDTLDKVDPWIYRQVLLN